MIVLGLSGLPNAQAHLRRRHPGIGPLDERICQGLDSAAALVVDGVVVAAAAEERFTGEKGTGRLPLHAVEYCLAATNNGSGPATGATITDNLAGVTGVTYLGGSLFVAHCDGIVDGIRELFGVPGIDNDASIQALSSTGELAEDHDTMALFL